MPIVPAAIGPWLFCICIRAGGTPTNCSDNAKAHPRTRLHAANRSLRNQEGHINIGVSWRDLCDSR
jgi:hypothetical protein